MSIESAARKLRDELTQTQREVHSIRMRTKEFLLRLPQSQRDAIAAKDNNFWRKVRDHFGNDITLTRLQKVLTIILGDKQ